MESTTDGKGYLRQEEGTARKRQEATKRQQPHQKYNDITNTLT
jgi:hypothetical protein